jgi:hypothetical protein
MTMLIATLAAVAAGTALATSAFAQSAREVRGSSPYVAIENEPAPKLIVDPPLPDRLARGIVQIQYHAFTGQTVTFAVPGGSADEARH